MNGPTQCSRQPSRPLAMAILALLAALAVLDLAACADDAEGNNPPVFAKTETELRRRVGELIKLDIGASDPDGDPVTIVAEKKPEGSEFVFSGIGRFSWAPLADDAGSQHELILVANDSRGGRATLRIVFIIESSNGAPRFTTSAQRVLDLTRTECLDTSVEVQDDDSAEVSLTVEDAPEGMVLSKLDGKRARLEWCPSQEQVNKQKKVFGATLVADDNSGSLVTQAFTIILITKNACAGDGDECGCNPPTLTHTPLGDQRAAGDYEIVATITDAESSVQKPTIAYAINPSDPDATGDYENTPMTAATGDQYRAVIPNPLLAAGQTADIFYFICAFDDDDSQGETCDNFACTPGTGVYHFVAFPAGDDSCRADEFEPNESFAGASTPPGDEVYGLSICQGDVDTFAYPLEANGSFAAVIAYDPSKGDLQLTLLDTDGGTVLEDGISDDVGSFLELDPVPTTGTYFLEVRGAQNSYELFTQSYGDSNACDDQDEPNDSVAQATPIDQGTRLNLSICPGDHDFYALDLDVGDQLDVYLTFSNADGDLDMALHRAEGGSDIYADSSTDDELLQYVVRQAGVHTLEILGFDDATNDYELAVGITHGTLTPCDPDSGEPANDSPAGAAVSQGTQSYEGFGICPDDEDYFGVNMLFGERIKATLQIADTDEDLDLALIDSDMRSLLTSSEGFTSTEVLYYTASFSGVYYLAVYGDQVASSPYTLDVVSCLNDETEPNDTRATAHGMGPGTATLQSCLGEADWYTIDLQQGQVILVEVTPQHAEDVGDIELSLYGPDGAETPLESARAAGGTLSLLRETLTAGTFAIRVKGLNNDSSPVYDLAIEVD